MVPLLRSEHPAGATTLLWLMRAHTYTADTAGDKYVVRLLWCCIVSYSPTGAACINTAHTYRHLLIVLIFILYAFNLYLSKFVFVWRKIYQFDLKWLKSACTHLMTSSELLQTFVISLTFCFLLLFRYESDSWSLYSFSKYRLNTNGMFTVCLGWWFCCLDSAVNHGGAIKAGRQQYQPFSFWSSLSLNSYADYRPASLSIYFVYNVGNWETNSCGHLRYMWRCVLKPGVRSEHDGTVTANTCHVESFTFTAALAYNCSYCVVTSLTM